MSVSSYEKGMSENTRLLSYLYSSTDWVVIVLRCGQSSHYLCSATQTYFQTKLVWPLRIIGYGQVELSCYCLQYHSFCEHFWVQCVRNLNILCSLFNFKVFPNQVIKFIKWAWYENTEMEVSYWNLPQAIVVTCPAIIRHHRYSFNLRILQLPWNYFIHCSLANYCGTCWQFLLRFISTKITKYNHALIVSMYSLLSNTGCVGGKNSLIDGEKAVLTEYKAPLSYGA